MNIPDGVDWKTLPSLIQFLLASQASGIGIGLAMYNEAIEKHPEFFVEEIDRAKKWASIPEEVRNQYFGELYSTGAQINKECDACAGGGGLLYWIDHPFEMNEYFACLKRNRPIHQQNELYLHNKYLAIYGIEYVEKE